ncbi:hypothetical protein L3Q82_025540 [Scortum barcoo]|uniref:Uncharacterized protein n=1 Tax=Scortum barcoo TaxID=214431 RepID=A0ACB8WP84_9TELE|nr:hypothetical protein L3Q82_025540 [Scortum barcoo]
MDPADANTIKTALNAQASWLNSQPLRHDPRRPLRLHQLRRYLLLLLRFLQPPPARAIFRVPVSSALVRLASPPKFSRRLPCTGSVFCSAQDPTGTPEGGGLCP